MKKRILLCLLLVFLLTSCAAKPQKESPSDTDNSQASSDAARIAYYEELVEELRQELLDVKTALYTSRVECEALQAELDSLQESETQDPSTPPAQTTQFTYTIVGENAVITSYIGNAIEISVPASLDGYPVTAIGDRAFANHPKLVSVSLPSGVQTIGWFAFSGCVSLSRIRIPQTVEAISYGAFENCPAALTIITPADSYAAQYAASYGIARSEG